MVGREGVLVARMIEGVPVPGTDQNKKGRYGTCRYGTRKSDAIIVFTNEITEIIVVYIIKEFNS